MPKEIKARWAETWWFSSEGRIMYPLCKAICPLLHPLGITPNMITISNVFVGLANGYAIYKNRWFAAWALNFLHQLLDAMDGTMARMFKMHTEFGAKLDEFTDIFFGVVLALSSFLAVWPDPLLCGGVLVAALLLLSGDLAWSQGGKDKKYIEDLTWMQLWGLWGIECQSYNMWFMLAIIASPDQLRQLGILPAFDPATDGLDKYMSWKLLPMLALVLASSLVLRHAIVKGVFARGKAERRE